LKGCTIKPCFFKPYIKAAETVVLPTPLVTPAITNFGMLDNTKRAGPFLFLPIEYSPSQLLTNHIALL
jgi:hypothetical protein